MTRLSLGIAVVLLTTSVLRAEPVVCRGEVTFGTLDSGVGDCSFSSKAKEAATIFSVCKMGDQCQVEGEGRKTSFGQILMSVSSVNLQNRLSLTDSSVPAPNSSRSPHTQGLDFDRWSMHTIVPNGGPACYIATQLSNSTQGVEVRVTNTDDGNLAMVLHESDWETQPDQVSTLVRVTFYTEALEEYSRRFRAFKKGKSIGFEFGPTESSYVRDWLSVSTTMKIDLVRTKDAASTASSEPMLSEIKLPWTVNMSGAQEALAQLPKCNANIASASKPSTSSTPMKEEDKVSLISNMYITYSIAERCAGSDASFNQQQIAAMRAFVKARVNEIKISREDNDKTWNFVQSQVAALRLTLKDCADTRQQSTYLFPEEVFTLGGKRSPF